MESTYTGPVNDKAFRTSKKVLKAIVAGETTVEGISLKAAKGELTRRQGNKPFKTAKRAEALAVAA